MGLLNRLRSSRELDRFRGEFDDLLERFGLESDWFRRFPFDRDFFRRELRSARPALESFVEGGNFVVRADLPGIDPNNLDIRVVGDVLTIKGSREKKLESKKADFFRREIRYGSFERSITLPEGVKAEDLKATYHNGVLEISAPMPKEAGPKEVKIQLEDPQGEPREERSSGLRGPPRRACITASGRPSTEEGYQVRIEQLMTRDVKVCTQTDTLNRAAQLMWDSDCGCVPVIAANGDGKIIGVVTDRDIAMAAYTQGKPLWAIPVSTAMAQKVIACHANDGITQAEALMRDNRVRRLPVLDQNERLVGILSLNDVAREAQREASAGRRAEVTGEGVSETLASVCEPRAPRQLAVAASGGTADIRAGGWRPGSHPLANGWVLAGDTICD